MAAIRVTGSSYRSAAYIDPGRRSSDTDSLFQCARGCYISAADSDIRVISAKNSIPFGVGKTAVRRNNRTTADGNAASLIRIVVDGEMALADGRSRIRADCIDCSSGYHDITIRIISAADTCAAAAGSGKTCTAPCRD